MCSCLSFPLSFNSDTYLSSKTKNLGINLFLTMCFFSSRSSIKIRDDICQLLIWLHSVYICILSVIDTSIHSLTFFPKWETLAPDVKKNLAIDLNENAVSDSDPTDCKRLCPGSLDAGVCHPRRTSLSFSSYPSLGPAQKQPWESVTDWKDVSLDINYLLI